jgi:hypothetical protein
VKTQEHVIGQLAKANPIPDFENFEVVDLGATSFLNTLEQRSSTMTKLETRPEQKAPRPRALLTAIVAFIAVLVMGVAVAFIANRTVEPAALPVETLVGGWDVTSDSHVTRIEILNDGTYTLYMEDMKEGLRVGWGTYEFQGDSFALHGEGGRACEISDSGQRVGSDGVFSAAFEGSDAVTLATIEDECPTRGADFDGMTLVRNDS